jgi:hypothetical protein
MAAETQLLSLKLSIIRKNEKNLYILLNNETVHTATFLL